MGLFEEFPYTNFHEMNTAWIVQKMKELEAAWNNFSAGNSLNFADPIVWDASKTYPKNTIVLSENGNAYLSLKIVTAGIGLDNTEYWLMVWDYEAFMEKINKNFTGRYYRNESRAKTALNVGDWLTFDDVLCKVIADIANDAPIIMDTNIQHFTVEDFIKDFTTSMTNSYNTFTNNTTNTINQYKNDIDNSEAAYRLQLANDIATTTASLQAQLTAAISGATVDSEVINARIGAIGNGDTYATLGDAIRTQVGILDAAIAQIGKHITMTPEGYVDYTNGNIVTATSIYKYSDYIEIVGDVFYFHSHIVNNAGIAFYDNDHAFISGYGIPSNPSPYAYEGYVSVPSGAKYVRISTRDYPEEVFYICGGLPEIVAFTQLKDTLEGSEVFDITWTDGAYVYGDGPDLGYTYSNADYSVTNYIPVKQGMKINIKTYMIGPYAGICFFEQALHTTAISGIVNASGTSPYLYEDTVEVPVGANYMRVSCRKWKNEAIISLNVIETILNIAAITTDWTYAGLDKLASTGSFTTEQSSWIGYKNTQYAGDNGTRFYLIPKAQVTSGTGGCLKIFADNYPSQGDYRDLGIYFSANQNGDTGYNGSGVDWINIKVKDYGQWWNKHPDLGFAFQDGAVVAGKIICKNGNKPVWIFGAASPMFEDYVTAEFKGNIGLSTSNSGILLTAPNGNVYKVSIDNSGNLVTSQVNI